MMGFDWSKGYIETDEDGQSVLAIRDETREGAWLKSDRMRRVRR